MTKEEKKEKVAIPYNTDTTVLGKILDDLKNSGSEGVNLKTLWANIGESNNQNKSYTLNMAKFLNLVDTDGAKVWLTPLGRSIGYVSGDKRNTLLAQNLPEIYMTMFKWIKYSPTEDMFANDIKVKFINTFGDLTSPLLLDRAIASFLHYCQYIGLIKYVGKGRGAKATLTEFGKKVLDLPTEEVKKEPAKEDLVKRESLLEGEYPIRIYTRDRIFDWDIKTEADLDVIDSVIKSIKEIWRSKKGSKHKPEGETTVGKKE
jgi:hypothetical protein